MSSVTKDAMVNKDALITLLLGYGMMDPEVFSAMGFTDAEDLLRALYPGSSTVSLSADAIQYLEDNMGVEVVFYDGKAISVEMPTTVVREVEYTEPAVRGDTSGKVMKPARIKPTGFELPVAAFVDIGDMIEIDTRTNEFKRRAN